jgi:hypothetical protein
MTNPHPHMPRRDCAACWAAGIGIVVASLLLLVALVELAAPASASAEGDCLNRHDFRQVSRAAEVDPVTRRYAHRLFGTRGTPIGFHTRVYRGCVEGSRAWVEYARWPDGRFRATSTAYTALYFADGQQVAHPARAR